jgi:predicted GTPase
VIGNRDCVPVSAKEGIHITQLKEAIARLAAQTVARAEEKPLAADLVSEGDFVILVTPIDRAAPKGRLILPQQQTIRDLLEKGAVPIVTKETQLAQTLREIGKKPRLVITDSQAFSYVDKAVPGDIPLTSFSVLFARYKGQLRAAVEGARYCSARAARITGSVRTSEQSSSRAGLQNIRENHWSLHGQAVQSSRRN